MAYDIGYDIIVKDDECASIKTEFDNRAKKFDELLSRYEDILSTVINDGIKEGQAHDNLLLFQNAVKTLEGEAANIAEVAKSCSDDFVSDMDTADNCLF